jgi:hypothetical protein
MDNKDLLFIHSTQPLGCYGVVASVIPAAALLHLIDPGSFPKSAG